VQPPQTRFTQAGGVRIAYQVVGSGPLDVVFVPGMIGHVDFWWEDPRAARLFRRLASFARLILFDKRGIGASDRSSDWAPLEERIDDLRAVMDATAAAKPAIIGVSEGGPMSLLFAATHPSRCRALCLVGGFAKVVRAPDYPLGFEPEQIEQAFENFVNHWGEPGLIDVLAPSLAADPEERARWARFERVGSNPAAIRAAGRVIREIDLRSVLPQVRAPTLILHARGDLAVPVGVGRYLAEHIPGAKYVEYESPDHVFWTQPEQVVDPIEEFLTGTRAAAEPSSVLATIVFVDIAKSTERAAELGDSRWAELLSRYRALLRQELALFRGSELDEAGDGLLAAFDGPARAVRFAERVRDRARELELELRASVHTGECERLDGKLVGLAVHVGARLAELAAPGEVVVSGTVRDLVAGSGLRFVDRGTRALRGVPGEWRLFTAA
jgi:pimeloyl-ACP methyl ester carboxylesterase